MKLLLVEDEIKLSEALSVLIRRAGFEVDTAPDGVIALQKIRAQSYDIIIMDRMLPHMDGLSVLREMRRDKNNTPVLLLTAKDAPHERVAGLEAGADDYLIKPFFTDELLARIKVLVRRNSTKKPEGILEAGGIILFQMQCEVIKADQKIPLTVKETALLALLMQNVGQVVTKERIIEKIWGYDSEVGSSNVDLYIYYLRKKLNIPQIKTIRGIGYSFMEEN